MTASGRTGEKLALVTGTVGSGKSTVVRRVLDRVRERGHSVAGLWCPEHRVEGSKAGIRAVDLAGGENRLLAVRQAGRAKLRTSPEKPGLQKGPYLFDPDVFAWANRLLLQAIESRPDLLVIDEIGPLELEQDAGLAPALSALSQGSVPSTLIIVRDRCLEQLRGRLPSGRTGIFTVDADSRGSLHDKIVSWLFGPPGVS